MKTYIRSIGAVVNGWLYFNGKVEPLEARDATGGKLTEGDICLVEDDWAYPLTSDRFGNKEVLEINEQLV